MASEGFRNIVSVLALCEGTALRVEAIYKERNGNKTALAMVERVYTACHAAHALWDGGLDAKDIKRIEDRLQRMERACFVGQTEDVSAYTSLCLALLDDLFGCIRDHERVRALDAVHAAILRLHRHFDRKWDRWEAYESAGRAVAIWGRYAA